jgi:hypothetical protein
MSERGLFCVLLLALAVASGTTRAAAPPVSQPLRALARARFEAARAAYQAAVEALRVGRGDAEKVYLWSRRTLKAQQALGGKKPERVAACAAHLERMEALRKLTVSRYHSGITTYAEVVGTGYYVAEARLWLAEARAG